MDERPRPRGRRARVRTAVALVSLVGLLAGCSGAAQGQDSFSGTVLGNPYSVDDAALTDTEGQPFSLAADTDSRLTLVFFGYTHCPDTCLIVMSTIASAMRQLDQSDRDQVQVVFVTTDPARDTESVLRTYLDRLDPTFLGLTGDRSTIAEVGRSVAAGAEKGEKLPQGGYEVMHSTQVLGVDVGDQVGVYWSQDVAAHDLADDVHTLLATS